MRPWQVEEPESFITSVEENHERLRDKPADWINRVKDDVFFDNQHVTAQKVRDKYGNLNGAWKNAKAMQEQSGFGLREDNCEVY